VNADAEKVGVRWLLGYAIDKGCGRAAIVVPGAQSIDALKRACGDDVAQTLRRHRQITVRDDLVLEVLLSSRLPFSYDGPVFAPWADDEIIDKVEEMIPPAICAMPWARGHLSVWRSSWALHDPRTGSRITSPVHLTGLTTAALEDLTEFINLGTGLGHPSDKAMAVGFLKALRYGGEVLDGDTIRAWAIAHGWSPRHAKDLGELAQKIADGVAVRGGRPQTKTEMNQQLGRWREARAA